MAVADDKLPVPLAPLKELPAIAQQAAGDKLAAPVQFGQIRYAVLHTLPGRVRLRVRELRDRPELAGRLTVLISSLKGVECVRLNRWCANLVITFDRQLITLGQILDLLDGGGVWTAEPEVVEEPVRTLAKQSWLSRVIFWIERFAPAAVQCALGAGAFLAACLEMPSLIVNGLLAAAVAPIAGRALSTAVSERRIGVDALDGIAAVLMITNGKLVAAGFMTALIGLGEFIRELTAQRCQKMIADLLGLAGRSAWLVRGKKRVCVPADQVQVGDTIVVYPGDMVPVDGIVISGEAAVNQASLTGESMPVEVSRGSRVFAATVVVEGKVYIKCEAAGRDTRAGLVVDMVRSAPIHETRVQNYAAVMADKLVLPVLLGACVCLAFTRNVTRAMSIVIFDFATGIRIAAPTAILASMQRAGHHGILIKSGGALERLAKVDAILFDKTGTLTAGEPHVTEVITMNGLATGRVLELAAAVEQRLHHPAARAIVRHAGHHELPHLDRARSVHMRGMGVRASVDGLSVLVGSRRLMESEKVDVRQAHSAESTVRARGESLAYVSVNGELAALIAYSDRLRPEVPEVIGTLRRRGVKEIVMVTGDNEGPARAVARSVGIADVMSGAFPEQKAELVRQLKDRGFTVAVVGDGINDSPALAHADVAISLHGGTDAAREHADVILTDDDLRRLPEAIDIARGAMRLVRQNLSLVAIPNSAGLVLAAAGLIGPAGATLLNNGSAIVAAINSLRPLYSNQWSSAEQINAQKLD